MFQPQMFQQPSWITMAIASTRMHRSPVDFTYESTDVYAILYSLAFSGLLWSTLGRHGFSAHDSSLQDVNYPAPKNEQSPLDQRRLDKTKVAAYAVSEHHPTLQAGNDDSCASNTNQPHENPNGLSRDEDLDHSV
jgi:hypothetical protein